jgi:hypothetical protein
MRFLRLSRASFLELTDPIVQIPGCDDVSAGLVPP